MIDVLTPEQQAQLQKLMGDDFDLKDQGPGNFRGRFGRGGGTDNQGRGRSRGNSAGDQSSSKSGS